LWKRDAATTEPPSDQLPPEKFDLQIDQAHSSLRGDVPKADAIIPLLCQEACNLLVGECRKAVQAGRDVSPEARSEESA
jgi:hypothetical protein